MSSHPWRITTDPEAPIPRQPETNLADWTIWLSLKIAARFVSKIWPQASRNLLHYLGNTGKPLRQDLSRMLIEVHEFRSRVDEYKLEIARRSFQQYECLKLGVQAIFGFQSRWMKFTSHDYRHTDWFLALGDWEYQLTGYTVVFPSEVGLVLSCIIVARISIRDCYDWDCGPRTNLGLFSIPNRLPARLQRLGIAKEFVMHGDAIVISKMQQSECGEAAACDSVRPA